jgi:hypothetical protein
MKILSGFIFAASLLAAASAPAWSCEIFFETGKMTAALGREIQATVTVVLEHRNCKIPMAQTTIEGKGLTIVKQGSWARTKADTYTLDITFVLDGLKGELRVIRECDKKGISEGVLKVTAQ